MAVVQEVITSLNLDKKCLSLFPWKEGGEPDISTSFSQLFFKAVICRFRHAGLFAVFLYLCFCFIEGSGKNRKYRCLKSSFMEYFPLSL